MKKIIAWLLVLALTAAISVGATLAYLTDTDEDVNVMTLGKVKIDQLEYERVDVESKDDDATVQEFHDNKPLLPAVTDKDFTYIPGDTYVDWDQIGKDGYTSKIWNPEKINNEVDKMVFIKNKGNYDAFVRSVFAFEAGNYTTLDQFKSMMHLNLNEDDFTWEWVQTPVAIPNAEGGTTNYFVATATYNKVLAPGALTEISLSQIALDKTATNEDVEAFGDTYQILVKSQGIQADGFNNAIMALNDGFDVIDARNIPWETDAPVVGTDVRTALKYLNADPTGTDITAKVTKVVFGLNSDHPEIVNGYEGILTSVEQDVPVHTYYVPNGSNYDVYMLANSEIYLPKDSGRLFQDMSALTSVDTSNLNTSRVVLMNHLFFRCSSLTDVDVSGFDTSNVTTMKSLFNNCKKLKFVDVANWDTSNVTDTSYFLNNCVVMETLDVSGWDTSKVTITEAMFQYCRLLEKITGIENFKTGNVETMGWMFYDCKSLKSLDLSGWDTSKVTAMNSMFSSNISNAGDMALSYLNISTWDTGNVTKMNHMFNGCAQLKELDLSKWDMSKVRTTSHMFADCFNIQSIDFTGWNTASLTSMDAMFNDCRTIKEIDVSHFDTGNCLEFSQMFEACYALEKIIGLDQWDTSSGYVFDEMFNVCGALKELDLSSFDTSAATYGYILQNGEKNYHGYGKMFNGTTGLQKLIMSDKFVFAGDGTLQPGNYPQFPNPKAKEGYTAMWRNVETGELFLGKDIPEKTAATYEAYYQYAAKGAKLVDALHYLNANTSGTKITKKVTKVVFGLNKDYPDITSTYTGVLADQEQDVPVYVYYVPDGTNYHIYFLADSAIYAPKDCTDLFLEMSALKAVDTANFDMSRAQILYKMFRLCGALTDIDVSNWNTSNVTSMRAMFSGANSLISLDTTKWDTSKVVEMNNMFYDCFALTEIKGHENWDTSSATSMVQMFLNCRSLTTLQLGNWDVSNVTRFKAMFASLNQNAGDMAFTDLDIENWDMSSATDLEAMFYGCGQLTSLDLSKWNVENVTKVPHMFSDCHKLESIDLSGWNTKSLTCMDAMFNHCTSLKVIDMSNFTTDKVKEFSQLFEACWSLEKIIGLEKWNTQSGQDFSEMFNQCYALKELDLSTFVTVQSDRAYITYYPWTNNMFHSFLSGCNSLEKITFGPSFSFDGNGTAPADCVCKIPAATNVEGWDGKWYTADGTGYQPSEIPEMTAATYYAVKPVNP